MSKACGCGAVLGFHVILLFVFLVSSSLHSLLTGEGEHLCLVLKLQVINYVGVWEHKLSRNMWEI